LPAALIVQGQNQDLHMIKKINILLTLLIAATIAPTSLRAAAPSDCESDSSDYSWLETESNDTPEHAINSFTHCTNNPFEVDTTNDGQQIADYLAKQEAQQSDNATTKPVAKPYRFVRWVKSKFTHTPKKIITHPKPTSVPEQKKYAKKILPIMKHLEDTQKSVDALKTVRAKERLQRIG
jgi:hypothetical protein